MRKIGKVIGDFIDKTFKHDITIDQTSINNCVLITYLPNMVFPEHRDVTFTKDGKYDAMKNSQAEKTITAILVAGDARQLDFHLYKQGAKIVKAIKEEGRHFFELEHGTLFLLHPEDERPFVRAWCPEHGPTFFKHSSKGLGKGNGMSLGIAMRFVCQINEVTDSGSLIMNDCIFPEKYRDSETMLQNYLANEDEKKSREREYMMMWKKCLEKHFNVHHRGDEPWPSDEGR
jgi:hypothetical protein